MCDKELLVTYAYDDVTDEERASFEAHLAACADCRDELDGIRQLRSTLSAWTPPRPDLAFRIVDRAEEARARGGWRGWWTPAAGLAAAAVLVLAAASAVAHVEVRYGADGMSVRTGWDRATVQPVAASVAAADPAVAAQGRTLEAEYAAIERRIQDLETAARTTPAVRTVSTASPRTSDDALLRRVRDLLAQSELRQQQELALRIAQVNHDVDAQRSADLNRIQQGIGRIDAMTTAEAAAHQDLAKYIVTSARQK